MSKKLQLSIPKPCHEDWDAMTPVEKGKFCGSCQKQVVDFSNMSDRQVAEFFKKPSTGSVCGRFMTDQLERDIEIPKKRIPWLKYFFQFVIPAFLVSIKATAQTTKGKIKVNTVRTDTTRRPLDVKVGIVERPICTKPLIGDTIITPVKYPVETIKGEISNITIDARNRTIVGKVTDEKGDIISGATVIIKGTRTGVVVDKNGQFQIQAKVGDALIISALDFEPAEVTVRNNETMSISIKSLINVGFEVGLIVYSYSVKPRKELKNVPLIPDIANNEDAVIFKTFPNPVESGNSLNIEIQKVEEGYYDLQLINQSGQSMYQQEIWIDAEARLLNIDIPSLSAGSYFLAMTNKRSGKRSTEKIIIQ